MKCNWKRLAWMSPWKVLCLDCQTMHTMPWQYVYKGQK